MRRRAKRKAEAPKDSAEQVSYYYSSCLPDNVPPRDAQAQRSLFKFIFLPLLSSSEPASETGVLSSSLSFISSLCFGPNGKLLLPGHIFYKEKT